MKGEEKNKASDLPGQVLETARRAGLDDYLLRHPLVVGVSGGPDSLALLHILRELRGDSAPTTLHVAHLDHAFRGDDGAEDARFVADLARGWDLPCTVYRVDVPAFARANRLSPEEAARKVRYAFLGGLAATQRAAVAVAHTADDQAETVLMNLLRGAGIGGLAGMRMLDHLPAAKGDALPPDLLAPTAPVFLFRPLLQVWRTEIEAYCATAGLQPRTDATNSDPSFTRNRIRRELLPLLEREYNPAVKRHLLNLSEIASLEDGFMEELAAREGWRLAEFGPSNAHVRLPREGVDALPEALRRRVARWALAQVAGTLDDFTFDHVREVVGIALAEPGSPSAAHLPHGLVVERVESSVIIRTRDDGSQPAGPSEGDTLKWPLLRTGEALRITPGAVTPMEAGWSLVSAVLRAAESVGAPGDLCAHFDLDALPSGGVLWLRTRREGDYIRPLGMSGSKSLQDLFVDAKMPRRARDSIALAALTEGAGEVLWVPGPGGRRSAHAPITAASRNILQLEFTRTGERGTDGTSEG